MNFNSAFNVAKKVAAVLVTSAICVSSAQAYTLDTFLGSANLGNSSVADELAAMEAAAKNSSLVLSDKVTAISGTAQIDPSTAGQYFIDVGANTPGYFLLKFGTGGTGSAQDTFFFQNVGELTKLVFSNSQVNFLSGGNCGAANDSACNIGRLSHYDIFNGTTGGGGGNSVPEPTTVALIGLGLLGFAASRRKEKSAKAA